MESFEILKLLGKGAYGRALLCRDVRHPDDGDDESALVVVKQVTSLDAAQVLEATKEARILGRLDHPNVVAFYESFTEHSVVEGAVLSIVMEFCDGGDLAAVVEADCNTHVVHLGTMGVYGYGNSGGEIPEGYIDVVLPGGRDSRILHPAYPGSVYHTTKCLDALLFQFYAKNDGVRVTDLHQGIVWGTNTDLTSMDPRLTNRFDYDGDYGTVLNRFLMQAALNVPMTVYGTGGQTRAFIHISDTCKCIEIAINNPPAEGAQPEIFNQVAETRRVRDIAELISKNTGVEARFLANPRQEAAENELDVSNRKFRALGFEPTKLNDALFEEVQDVTQKYKDRCIPTKILPASFWNKKRAQEVAADKEARGAVDSAAAAGVGR